MVFSKKIDGRTKHNQKSIIQIEEARQRQDDILNRGYTYRSFEDYEELVEYLEVRKHSQKNMRNYIQSKKKKCFLMEKQHYPFLKIHLN